MLEDSILKSTKKLLGIADDYDAFDLDVVMNVNSAFMSLRQLGVGPDAGFLVQGDLETWGDYFGAEGFTNFEMVKTYVYLKTKLAFDPPQTSFGIEAIKEQIREHEFRLNHEAEGAVQNGS